MQHPGHFMMHLSAATQSQLHPLMYSGVTPGESLLPFAAVAPLFQGTKCLGSY